MYRWISIPVVVLLLAILVAAGLFYLSYRLPDHSGQPVPIAGLTAPVQLARDDRGVISIQAFSEQDAMTALGYAHALERGWLALLMRQTALGRTAEWFGEGTADVDRFTRTLGLGRTARAAFQGLSTEDRALLTAYARGFNTALNSSTVRSSDELAMLELEPEPWEPWHVLAVERLYAWVATEVPADSLLRQAGPEAVAFFKADTRLRSWLHLHGLRHSAAWAVRDSAQVQLYQRQVYGDIAITPYQEILIRWGNHPTTLAATLPGTTLMPSGRSQAHAWSILPYGRLVFSPSESALKEARMDYDRVRVKDGSEQLVRIRRSGRALVFAPAPAPKVQTRPAPRPDTLAMRDSTGADSNATARDTVLTTPAPPVAAPVPRPAWVLDWTGFSTVSDVGAWRSLLSGSPGAFRLITGSGLMVERNGSTTVLGTPIATLPLRGGVLVANTRWAPYMASSLDSLLVRPGAGAMDRIIGNTYSPWAARITPALVRMIAPIRYREPAVNEALTYLRNWDFSYDRASIGASIFETWVAAYRGDTGHLPDVQDTLATGQRNAYTAFLKAVARLQRKHGKDMQEWRWERTYPDVRYYPVWSEEGLLEGRAAQLRNTRFAPVHSTSQGHPTAVFWGPSALPQDLPSPGMWEVWLSTRDWNVVTVRRQAIELGSFLGRYRRSEDLPKPITIDLNSSLPALVTLVPPGASK